MKLNRWVCLLTLSSVSYWLAWACAAQGLESEPTEARAIARAKAEGKMILAMFGRTHCPDCTAMEAILQKTNPPLCQWLQASCVTWKANIDTSTEWERYAGGLRAFSLPLICLVDPAKPGVPLGRWTGLISAKTFLHHLQGQAQERLPLVVTNLPPGPLDGGCFIVDGSAQTNATMGGAIPGAAIERVLWRLNGTGLFQPATGTTNWSAQMSLPHGTNVFESYVKYEGAGNSWTNRVTLVNLGSGRCPLTITAHPRGKSYGTTLELGSDAFGVAGLLPGDAVAAVTLTASGGLDATDAVGEYWITPSAAIGSCGALEERYSITYVASTLTVEKAVLKVIANAATKQAGASHPAFTASYEGFVAGEDASVLSGSPAFTTTATSESGPGEYPITVTQGTLHAANYRFVFVPGTLTVSPSLAGDINHDGQVDQEELNAVLANYWATSPPYIHRIAVVGETNFVFTVTNFTFAVQSTTNLANPEWHDLGEAFFQFTDPRTVAGERCYYRLVAPRTQNPSR
ncbi:MAG TPA: MBG domain-containing protein [Verrucomicrobiota bacterium]|nr:MBG domain-containing protein [Verrucomicrobiota bacterium]